MVGRGLDRGQNLIFNAAADTLDKALAVAAAQESDIHYMSMVFRPSRKGGVTVTEAEWRTQSKGDLVCAHCFSCLSARLINMCMCRYIPQSMAAIGSRNA